MHTPRPPMPMGYNFGDRWACRPGKICALSISLYRGIYTLYMSLSLKTYNDWHAPPLLRCRLNSISVPFETCHEYDGYYSLTKADNLKAHLCNISARVVNLGLSASQQRKTQLCNTAARMPISSVLIDFNQCTAYNQLITYCMLAQILRSPRFC